MFVLGRVYRGMATTAFRSMLVETEVSCGAQVII